MAFFRCTILGLDGAEVARNVDVSLDDTSREGEWFGTITITHLSPLDAGNQLVLGDGRKGTFVVRRNTFAGGTNRAIAIHGKGKLG